MTEAIVWLVLWAVFMFGGAWLIAALCMLSGVAVSAASEKVWPAPTLTGIGYLLAASWFIFGAVQVISQVIAVIHHASA